MPGNYFSGMSSGWVGGWLGGWLGGWIIWKYNQLSPKLGWVGAWAELGNEKIKGVREGFKKKKKKVGIFQ